MKTAPLYVALAAALASACGAGSSTTLTPTLPGDGTAHTAPPVDPVKPPTSNDPWAGRTDLLAAPATPAPAPLVLPPVTRFTLANGLEVLVVADARLPTMSMQLAVKAGRDREPLAHLGVAELTANLLVKGTKTRSAAAIARAVDAVGATIATDATQEVTLVSCSVLAKDASTCLSLLPDVIVNPAFDEDELKFMRRQIVLGLRQRFSDPSALAADHVQNLLWGDEHQRGWIVDESDVRALRREDLLAWYAAWFAPNNAILTVAGDVNPKTLQATLTKAFGAWKKRTVAPAPTYVDPARSGIAIRLVDVPSLQRAQIRVGQLGIEHDDPAYFEALVWNQALGGGQPTSRLMTAVRAVSPTGAASAAFDRYATRGSYVASAAAPAADAVKAAQAIVTELKKMQTSGPTDAEIADARSMLGGAHQLRFQAAGDAAASLLQAELHGFGEEYLTNYTLRLAKVDAKAAAASAAAMIDPAKYVIVMVGNAAVLEPQLLAAGWRYTKVPFTEPIGSRPPPAPIPSGEPAGKTDAKSLASAQAIIDAAIKAKGGRQALQAITSLTLTVGGIIDDGVDQVPVQMIRQTVLPDKTRLDIAYGNTPPMAIGIVGNTGWQASGQGVVAIPPQELVPLQVERWREPEIVLLRAGESGVTVALLPSGKIAGRAHSKIRLNGPDNRWVVLWIDDKTKMLSRMTYDDEFGDGTTDDFADYRPVGGIQLAHRRLRSGVGQTILYQVASAVFNAAIDPATFAKPQLRAPGTAPAPTAP